MVTLAGDQVIGRVEGKLHEQCRHYVKLLRETCQELVRATRDMPRARWTRSRILGYLCVCYVLNFVSPGTDARQDGAGATPSPYDPATRCG